MQARDTRSPRSSDQQMDHFGLPLRATPDRDTAKAGKQLAQRPLLGALRTLATDQDSAVADEALHQLLATQAHRLEAGAPLAGEVARAASLLSCSTGDICLQDTLRLGALEKYASRAQRAGTGPGADAPSGADAESGAGAGLDADARPGANGESGAGAVPDAGARTDAGAGPGNHAHTVPEVNRQEGIGSPPV